MHQMLCKYVLSKFTIDVAVDVVAVLRVDGACS